MAHTGSCGWVGGCAKDGAHGVEDLEVFDMRGADVMGCCGWLGGIGAGVRVGSLEKIPLNEVWKVWVTNPLTKTIQAACIVWGYPQKGLEEWGREGSHQNKPWV